MPKKGVRGGCGEYMGSDYREHTYTHTHTHTHSTTHTSKWEPAGWCCVEAAETQRRACNQTKRPRKRIQTLTLMLSAEHLYHSAIYREAPVGSSEQKVRVQKTDRDHRDGESDAEKREIITI